MYDDAAVVEAVQLQPLQGRLHKANGLLMAKYFCVTIYACLFLRSTMMGLWADNLERLAAKGVVF